MTNLEKIQSLNPEEMARYICSQHEECTYCPACEDARECIAGCQDVLTGWLLSETEDHYWEGIADG